MTIFFFFSARICVRPPIFKSCCVYFSSKAIFLKKSQMHKNLALSHTLFFYFCSTEPIAFSHGRGNKKKREMLTQCPKAFSQRKSVTFIILKGVRRQSLSIKLAGKRNCRASCQKEKKYFTFIASYSYIVFQIQAYSHYA